MGRLSHGMTYYGISLNDAGRLMLNLFLNITLRGGSIVAEHFGVPTGRMFSATVAVYAAFLGPATALLTIGWFRKLCSHRLGAFVGSVSPENRNAAQATPYSISDHSPGYRWVGAL